MMKLLMVCMGNVCRSQMAQVVTLQLVEQAGLASDIRVDSAGTHVSRDGEAPDPRVKTVLSGRGYPIGRSHPRQISESDFGHYDLILVMDQANLDHLRRICPTDQAHKLRLFLEYAQGVNVRDVPDPYYGSIQGFERVLDLCEAGACGLVEHYQSSLR